MSKTFLRLSCVFALHWTVANASMSSATACDYSSKGNQVHTSLSVTILSFFLASLLRVVGFVIKSVLFPTIITGTGRVLSSQYDFNSLCH